MQKQARMYHAQGLELQNAGNYEAALSLYQKAAQMDPLYAIVHNDIGIIYEAGGFTDDAEASYLKAIAIDPKYASAYSNLALLYEGKRDIVKAAEYWQKRADLGAPNDPWTIRAKQRLLDINLLLSKNPFKDIKEQETLGLLKHVKAEKAVLNRDDKELARSYFEEAQLSYKKGNWLSAYKQSLDAVQLDPSNEEIADFVDKVHVRLLSR
jgi:tetratricopeptide (TPR) repeat protein